MTNFWIASCTDAGTKRKVNQDRLFGCTKDTAAGKAAFGILCDGMGGLESSEVASARVTELFTAWAEEELPRMGADEITEENVRLKWTSIVELANQELLQYAGRQGTKLGTTMTAILLMETQYYLMSIGDSRAYHMDRNGICQLSVDHTLIAREIALGNLTPEQAEKAPIRNVITRCIGVRTTVQPDMFSGVVMGGDLFMLCSDGFRHQLSSEELWQCLYGAGVNSTHELLVREQTAVRENMERGETDNISVIALFVREDGEEGALHSTKNTIQG